MLPQATVAYPSGMGTRTQAGLPPGATPPMMSPAGTYVLPRPAPAGRVDDYDDDRQRAAAGRFLTVLLSVLLIGGLLLAGGYGLSTAYKNFARQQQSGREWDRLQAAMGRFRNAQAGRGTFVEAAASFRALRESPNTEVRTRAPLYESYCYRSLGNKAIQATDLLAAERLFVLAVGCATEALARDRNSAEAQQEYQQAVSQLNEVRKYTGPASAGGGAVPGATPSTGVAPSGGAGSPQTPPQPRLDGMTPRTDVPPGPGAPSTSAFQNANAQKAAEAQRLLQLGDQAWQRGDPEAAVREWNRAVQAGPGSPGGLEAQNRLNRNNEGGSPL